MWFQIYITQHIIQFIYIPYMYCTYKSLHLLYSSCIFQYTSYCNGIPSLIVVLPTGRFIFNTYGIIAGCCACVCVCVLFSIHTLMWPQFKTTDTSLEYQVTSHVGGRLQSISESARNHGQLKKAANYANFGLKLQGEHTVLGKPLCTRGRRQRAITKSATCPAPLLSLPLLSTTACC